MRRKEVLEREIQQVQRAKQLDDRDLDQVHREDYGGDAKGERADDAVAERLPLVGSRQPEDEHRQDERVIGAEQPFENDEKTYRQEVVELDVHAGEPSRTLIAHHHATADAGHPGVEAVRPAWC